MSDSAAKVAWSEVCPACKGAPGQGHRYDETCREEPPAASRLRNPSADAWEARYNRALAERDNARGELDRLSEVVKNAARPLSRLRLSHSPACPYVHGEDGSLGGTCVCGVAEIEELAALAQKEAAA